jgi:hypothetical protein
MCINMTKLFILHRNKSAPETKFLKYNGDIDIDRDSELYLSTEACDPNWDDLPRRRPIWIIYNISKEIDKLKLYTNYFYTTVFSLWKFLVYWINTTAPILSLLR